MQETVYKNTIFYLRFGRDNGAKNENIMIYSFLSLGLS